MLCKAFSKDLIVRAIGVGASPDPSEGGEGLAGHRQPKTPKLGREGLRRLEHSINTYHLSPTTFHLPPNP
ncbi:Uncharacterised protein [Segatella buccae]|uniref:Uncharacterized protein n=1 Tax=Segatella buccae TaxID=28126 RepID=A0AAQ1ZIA7_9BACT|nr:Uncharacterised protein [Segatella buccae]